MPVPVRARLKGFSSESLLAMWRVAVLRPTLTGAKRTVKVVLPDGPLNGAVGLDVTANIVPSVPSMVIPSPVNVAVTLCRHEQASRSLPVIVFACYYFGCDQPCIRRRDRMEPCRRESTGNSSTGRFIGANHAGGPQASTFQLARRSGLVGEDVFEVGQGIQVRGSTSQRPRREGRGQGSCSR